MHYLHKVLVHIPKDQIEAGVDKETLLLLAHCDAVSAIDNYENTAFEWCRPDAGRWSDIYPKEAYLAADDLKWFLEELEEVLEFQKENMDRYLRGIIQSLGTDIREITEKLWNRSENSRAGSDVDLDLSAYYLSLLGQLLNGDYYWESHFYNVEGRTARLDSSDIDLIKQHPEEWALVMLDCYH